MRFSDTFLGVFFLLAGIALAWYSMTLPSIPGQDYGAATFPLFVALGFIACAARLIFIGLKQAGGSWLVLSDEMQSKRALLGICATIGLIVFYILFSHILGFIPTAFLVTFFMFLILSVPPTKAAVLAIVAAFACDFIFRTMLLVPLPFGIVPRLPW